MQSCHAMDELGVMSTTTAVKSNQTHRKLCALFSLLLLLWWGAIISGKRGNVNDLHQSQSSIIQKVVNFCPVSGELDITRNHLFNYPIDIYVSAPNLPSLRGKPYYNCSARRVQAYSQHQCPDNGNEDGNDPGNDTSAENVHCPVHQRHVDFTLNATSWGIYNNQKMIDLLYKIFKHEPSTSASATVSGRKMRDSFPPPVPTPAPVRVIFLGGSVTAGHQTEGYCCSNMHTNSEQKHLLDFRCNKVNSCSNYFQEALPFLNHEESTVSWVKYFSKALAEKSHVPLEFHSLAAPGTTSNYMASHISGFLNKLPRRNYSETSNDIIFVDYSFNDGRVFQGPKRSMLDQAIESLVRNVLSAYPATPAARPFIILLESYVHSHGVFERKCSSSAASGNSNGSNMNNLSDNNMLSCAKQNENQILQQSSDYSSAYRRIAKHYGLQVWSTRSVYWELYHRDQQKRQFFASLLNSMTQGHPPWHTHLFWADLYLSAMEHGLPKHLNTLPSRLDEFLPPALVKAEDISSQQCDWHSPLLAELSFDFNGNISPSSTYSTIPPDSWLFDKGGGDKPGWMTQNFAPNHTLVVPLNATALLLWTRGRSKQERLNRLDKRDIVIVFSYLKSYEKMLTVSLELCNHIIATENALWSDHFSLSYTTVLPIGHFMEKHCGDFIRQLDNATPPSTQLQSALSVSVHSPAPHLVNRDPTSLDGKFKLLGMTVCETDTGGSPFFSAQTSL